MHETLEDLPSSLLTGTIDPTTLALAATKRRAAASKGFSAQHLATSGSQFAARRSGDDHRDDDHASRNDDDDRSCALASADEGDTDDDAFMELLSMLRAQQIDHAPAAGQTPEHKHHASTTTQRQPQKGELHEQPP